MAPKTILVTRHAEKPADPNDVNLSPAGYARAQHLVGWIPETFGPPNHIFAAADSKQSHRPVETVQPLAASLDKSIHADFTDDNYAGLAGKLLSDSKYEDEMILVCWHHEKIPNLCDLLGAPGQSYPGDTFDVVLRLDYDGSNTPEVTRITEPF